MGRHPVFESLANAASSYPLLEKCRILSKPHAAIVPRDRQIEVQDQAASSCFCSLCGSVHACVRRAQCEINTQAVKRRLANHCSLQLFNYFIHAKSQRERMKYKKYCTTVIE